MYENKLLPVRNDKSDCELFINVLL